MFKLYLQAKISEKNEIYTTLESLITLLAYEFLKKPERIEVIFIDQATNTQNLLLKTKYTIDKHKIIKRENVSAEVRNFKLPIFCKENTFIAGMCAVCREIIKADETGNNVHLLGFKQSCLLAPTEHSVWTKFCEIDVLECVRFIWKYDFEKLSESDNFHLPEVFSKFESHLGQPIRVHNMYKVIREEIYRRSQAKEENFKSKNVIDEKFLADNRFAEGYWVTLADVILFICFTLLYKRIPNLKMLKEFLPLTSRWYSTLLKEESELATVLYFTCDLTDLDENLFTAFNFTKPKIQDYSLYKSDPKRYKPKNRIYTRQEDIDIALEKMSSLQITVTSENECGFQENDFDWSNVDLEAQPEHGGLPDNRLIRKKQQLENLSKAVIHISRPGDRIIDFCSGSGHLGLILAAALPNCHIMFLENKERSLLRAKDRVEKMRLNNVSFYQCNLDYFEGTFDVGTSLHACGTATDIVISKCLKSKAKFVCCPCCYGGINPMPHISYPLSKKFRKVLTEKDYLHVAHCSDQFHDKATKLCNIEKSIQGEYCMDVIDTDRKMWAEELGYDVTLTRLKPESCSLKNRLLIGVI